MIKLKIQKEYRYMFSGASQILVIKQGKCSDEFVCFFYKKKISLSSHPSSSLYRKSWVEWSRKEIMQSKKENRHVILTESYIKLADPLFHGL